MSTLDRRHLACTYLSPQGRFDTVVVECIPLRRGVAAGKCWVGPSSKLLAGSSFVCFALVVSATSGKCLHRAVSYGFIPLQ